MPGRMVCWRLLYLDKADSNDIFLLIFLCVSRTKGFLDSVGLEYCLFIYSDNMTHRADIFYGCMS